MAAAFLIRPLVEYFRRCVLESGRVGTDDTPVTVLLPGDRYNLPPPIDINTNDIIPQLDERDTN